MRVSREKLNQIHETDQFITSDKFLNASKHRNFNYLKRDYIFRPGRWRNSLQLPVWANTHKYRKYPLVVGHSDYSTGFAELYRLKLLGIPKVYGSMTLNTGVYSHSIPVGLTNDCDDGSVYRILGNTSHFKKANEHSEPIRTFDGSIYINFDEKTNFKVRGELLKQVAKLPNVIYGDYSISDSSRIKYLEELRTSSLVLCPEGNGFDSHRLWETLYMGGTPVIVKNPYLPIQLNQLPVIQLNDWHELQDLNYLEAQWNHLDSGPSNLDFLYVETWINRFSQSFE